MRSKKFVNIYPFISLPRKQIEMSQFNNVSEFWRFSEIFFIAEISTFTFNKPQSKKLAQLLLFPKNKCMAIRFDCHLKKTASSFRIIFPQMLKHIFSRRLLQLTSIMESHGLSNLVSERWISAQPGL